MIVVEYYAAQLGRSAMEVASAVMILRTPQEDGPAHLTVVRWDENRLGIPKPSDEELARIDALPEPAPDMPVLRQSAFATAMAYGNALTARVTGTYSDVEARTWPLQRTQADTVLHGGELPLDALLIKLAARRNMAVEPFALLVQAKAQSFEAIADVGQGLRLAAEGLLDPSLDTPAKLDAAVEALRAQTLQAASALGLTV